MNRKGLKAGTAGMLACASVLVVGVTVSQRVDARVTPARPALELSTRQAVDGYLRSIGADPARAVFEVGARNYAGPNCPGAGWNCAPAGGGAVVQESSADGVNVFNCTPASAGTSAASDTCVIVQTSSSGSNSATCEETNSNAAPNATCTITQTDSTGKNSALVEQLWSQGGDSASAGQSTSVTQQNGSGENDVSVTQMIAQKVKDSAASQDQEATQLACVQQDSPSGINRAQVRQTLTQNEQELGTNTSQTQNQNSGPSSSCGSASTSIDPNLAAFVQQDQGSASDTGANTLSIDQSLHQKMISYPTTGTVSQTQGDSADLGGMEAIPDQTSTAVSTATIDQNENQLMDAEVPLSSLSQNQFDPIHQPAEGTQTSNSSDSITINQVGVQNDDDGLNQNYDMEGSCSSSGTCQVMQSVTTNSGPMTQSCSNTMCDLVFLNEGG